MHLRSPGREGDVQKEGEARGFQHLLGDLANVNALIVIIA